MGSNTFFNANGIIAADRKEHPCIHEVRKVYCEIQVKAVDVADGKFLLKNKQLFSDLSKFDIAYVIAENGEILSKGTLDRAVFEKLAPLSEMEFRKGKYITVRIDALLVQLIVGQQCITNLVARVA